MQAHSNSNLALNQTVSESKKWDQRMVDRSKGSNRMAAFPGVNVKFPRCRLKIEREEAKKMKERLSTRKAESVVKIKELNGSDVIARATSPNLQAQRLEIKSKNDGYRMNGEFYAHLNGMKNGLHTCRIG